MILVINGSYRENGFTDKVVEQFSREISALGDEIEVLKLREYPIEFCLNCRECTQHPGDKPGECVHQDAMTQLVEKIENADAYILASPTNFGSATALFKRFMERLMVYAYWPWGTNIPKFRKAKIKKKKAILISSSAAPGFIARFAYTTLKQLKATAKTIGAESVITLSFGLVAQHHEAELSHSVKRKIKAYALTLVKQIS
ncbi:MAG: flavodoxin family protein [Psychromonas sp.]|nr:flavodoxin family protein [Psychromonas sp.]